MNSIDPSLARLSGELVDTVEVCLVTPGAESEGGSLGQITACLTSVVGKFRPMV